MTERTVLTPLGDMLLAAEGSTLTGAWFAGQKHFRYGLPAAGASADDACPGAAEENAVLNEACTWLADYFAGKNPPVTVRPAPAGTDFQKAVWRAMADIPYGCTETYGQLSERVGRILGRKTSARAVGQAVGKNPVSLFLPCHRVVGAGGSLTGYAGGVEKKKALLELESGCPAAQSR